MKVLYCVFVHKMIHYKAYSDKLTRRHKEVVDVISKLNIRESPLMINPMEFKQITPTKSTPISSARGPRKGLTNDHTSISYRGDLPSRSEIKFMSPQNKTNKKMSFPNIHSSLSNIIIEMKEKFSPRSPVKTLFNTPINSARSARNTGKHEYASPNFEKARFKLVPDADGLSQVLESRNEETYATKREGHAPSPRLHTRITTQDEYGTSAQLNISETQNDANEDVIGLVSTMRQNFSNKKPTISRNDMYAELSTVRDIFKGTKPEPQQPSQRSQNRQIYQHPPSQEQEKEDNASVDTKRGDDDESTEEIFCRICKDDESEGKLALPCDCKGSIAYSHNFCLQRWIESKAAEGSLKCEICRTPYHVITHKSIQKQPLIDFIKDPENKKMNLTMIVMMIIACGMLGGTLYSLLSLQIKNDMVIQIVHYFLLGTFSLAILSVFFFYFKKMITEDWEFVRRPQGKQLNMAMVSSKNQWNIVVVNDFPSQNNSNASASVSANVSVSESFRST